MSTDAQIAREWAEKVSVREKITFSVDDETLAVARHILATTTPPTMEDVQWDDAVHAGLCAAHADGGVVRMICLGWASGRADHILCYLRPGAFDSLPMSSLTPLPGTRLDLTPRREPESDGGSDESPSPDNGAADVPRPEDVPAGEPWIVEYGGHKWVGTREEGGWTDYEWTLARLDGVDYDPAPDNEVTLLRRLVPESTPAHPTVLTIEADYRNAPAGTVVATEGEGAWTWTKNLDGLWEAFGIISGYNNYAVSDEARQVLRWGWEA